MKVSHLQLSCSDNVHLWWFAKGFQHPFSHLNVNESCEVRGGFYRSPFHCCQNGGSKRLPGFSPTIRMVSGKAENGIPPRRTRHVSQCRRTDVGSVQDTERSGLSTGLYRKLYNLKALFNYKPSCLLEKKWGSQITSSLRRRSVTRSHI